MQQSELERAKRAPAADEEAQNLKATDQATMPAAPEQTRQSKHERVREARHLARDSQSSKFASKREAKHETLRIARGDHGLKQRGQTRRNAYRA